MTDRAKVMLGLQIHALSTKCEDDGHYCPYFESDECSSLLCKDVFELLKVQEPKKVKTDMYGNAYCPWCSTERTIEMGLRKLHLGTNFCPWCGQEVKWE